MQRGGMEKHEFILTQEVGADRHGGQGPGCGCRRARRGRAVSCTDHGLSVRMCSFQESREAESGTGVGWGPEPGQIQK